MRTLDRAELTSAIETLRRDLAAASRPNESMAALDLLERTLAEAFDEREAIELRLERLISNQRNLDDRLLAIEHGIFFRLLRAVAQRLGVGRTGPACSANTYKAWILADAATAGSAEQQRETAAALAFQPQIGVVLSGCNVRPEWQEAAVASIKAQTYENVTLAAGEGDYFALVHPHDLLEPDALFEIVKRLQQEHVDLLYCDEDTIDSRGERQQPLFKPGWSPELLTSGAYPGRFVAVSRPAMERVGWLSGDAGSAQVYDLVLRLAETAVSVTHVPRVLYHRRIEDHGQEQADARRALQQAVARRGWHAEIENGPAPGVMHVRHRCTAQPKLSVIVCSRKARLLDRLLRSLKGREAEVVVVEHVYGDSEDAARDALLRHTSHVRVPYEGAFNYSRMNNLGARAASGDVLVFLNDDVVPVTPDWLDRMAAQACRPEVGAVGALLVYNSGAIQHAGTALGVTDVAGHPGRRMQEVPHFPWLRMTRNVSAVTGACMAIRRAVFDQVEGFDPTFAVNYNDVDLCLRLRRAGYEVICDASSVLRHDESQTRIALVRLEERERFYRRWSAQMAQIDPYYNPNLSVQRDDASLRIEP